MRLKIGNKTYPPLSIDSVTIRDVILFDGEVRDLRADLGWTWNDVERVSEELKAMPEAEAERHPSRYFFLASLIWAVRRLNGEQVTFSEAADVDPGTVDFLKDPEDHQPGKPKGAKKPRKVSAPATAPAVAEPATTPAPQDSESPSIPE